MVKKVVWISSYLPRSCGIAYYSSHYIAALKEYARKNKKPLSIKIIAHTDALEADYPIINIKDRRWHYEVLDAIKKEKPDVVHIQHEYGLYETYRDCNKRVTELIAMIGKLGIPTVMTYHSVYKKLAKPYANFMSQTLKKLSAGIVHCNYQKIALKDNMGWKPNNVFVLPHGSNQGIKIDKNEARKGFGYTKDQFIIGSAGLAGRRKGFRTLIGQWPKVVKQYPTAILALELKPHAARETRAYINDLMKAVMESPVSGNIEIVIKDYHEEEFYRRLRSFDALVLPYRSESQSGVLAYGFSVGTPAIVTDIEGLGAEIRNSGGGIAVKKREDFYKAVIKMISSKKMRDKFSRNSLNYVKNVNGWPIIAKKTFDIYNKIESEKTVN